MSRSVVALIAAMVAGTFSALLAFLVIEGSSRDDAEGCQVQLAQAQARVARCEQEQDVNTERHQMALRAARATERRLCDSGKGAYESELAALVERLDTRSAQLAVCQTENLEHRTEIELLTEREHELPTAIAILEERKADLTKLYLTCTGPVTANSFFHKGYCWNGIRPLETDKHLKLMRDDQRRAIIRVYTLRVRENPYYCGPPFTDVDCTVCLQAMMDYVAKWPDDDPPNLVPDWPPSQSRFP